MQVALYARVSSERQEQQGTIASQLDALTRWAREQHHSAGWLLSPAVPGRA